MSTSTIPNPFRLHFSWRAAVLLLLAMATGHPFAHAAALEDITAREGGEAGLVVLVEPADVSLAGELAAGGRHLVVALSADAARVAQWDAALAEAGVHPVADAIHWRDPERLPFQSNAVNVLVVDRATAARLGDAEVRRVIIPRHGLALVDAEEVRKPRPEGMDVWQGWNQGPTGNRLSRDTMDPPNSIQWIGGWRHRGVGMHVISDRVHLIRSQQLQARDAFSGVARWNLDHRMGGYLGWTRIAFTDGQRLFLPQSQAGTRLPRGARTEERSHHDLLMESRDLLTGDILEASLPRIRWSDRLNRQEIGMGDWGLNNFLTHRLIGDGTRIYHADGGHTVRALSADGTEQLWEVTFAPGEYTDMVATDGEVLAVVLASTDDNPVSSQRHFNRHDNVSRAIVGLDPATGRQRWRYDGVDGYPLKFIVVDFGSVVASSQLNPASADRPSGIPGRSQRDNNIMVALEAATGAERFRRTGGAFDELPLVSQRSGLNVSHDHIIYNESRDAAFVFDLRTGEYLRPLPTDSGRYRYHTQHSATTARWVIRNNVFVSHDGQVIDPTPAEITAGNYSSFSKPANGMFYALPGFSTISASAHIGELMALTREDDLPEPRPSGPRHLVSGSARGIREAAPADWPTFRGDSGRRAWRPADGPGGALELAWSTTLWTSGPQGIIPQGWAMNSDRSGDLTPPVADGRRVVVAATERHELVCLDLADGTVRWRARLGGRIASPPTLAGEVAFVGVNDGTVSAISLEDGSVIWTFLAAPYERLHAVHQQIESTHPARSSPVLLDGTLYVSAGRHGRADHGIFLYALDPATGRPRAERNVTEWQVNDILQVVDGRVRLPRTFHDPGTLDIVEAPDAPSVRPTDRGHGGGHGWIGPTEMWMGVDVTTTGGLGRANQTGIQRDDRFGSVSGGTASGSEVVYEERAPEDRTQVLRAIPMFTGRIAPQSRERAWYLAGAGRYAYLATHTSGNVRLWVMDTAEETVTLTEVDVDAAHRGEHIIPDGIAIAHGHVILTTTEGRVLAFRSAD